MSDFIKRVQDVDSCNILGVGVLRGKWQISSFKYLVNNFLKDEDQRPYILKMNKFEKFCTVFDLDFRFEEKTKIPHEQLILQAHKLREIIQSETGKNVRILITRKGRLCYKKEMKKVEKGFCWASGCHMYMLKHRFTQSEATAIRAKFEPMLKGLNFLEDVIDDKVFPIGENGVYMIGSVKPECKLGLAHVPLCIVGEKLDIVRYVTPDTIRDLYLNEIHADDCYISERVVPVLQKETLEGKVKKPPKKKTYQYAAVENDLQTLEEDWNFNLDYFFELIKFFETEVSDLDNWKKIVFFLRNQYSVTNFRKRAERLLQTGESKRKL